MKQLWVTIGVILAIIGIWAYFYIGTNSEIDSIQTSIEYEVMPSIYEKDFTTASDKLNDLKDQLNSLSNFSGYFIDSEYFNQVNDAYIRSIEFIKAKDVSNSSGEIKSLNKRLDVIRSQELPNFKNIL